MPTAKRVHWQPPPSRIPWLLWGILVAVALVVIGAEVLWVKSAHTPEVRTLPVLAKVPDFSFTSEMGVDVTRDGLLGKIWVADFIFTRCTGPCPVMTEKMRQLQVASRHINRGNVHLVSVTVDPEYDTPRVLARYGARIGSNPDRWSFLTGDPAKVREFIVKGMLLGLSQGDDGVPVHSQKFVVVDREGYIRAYHDLSEAALVPNILNDLEMLSRESLTPAATP